MRCYAMPCKEHATGRAAAILAACIGEEPGGGAPSAAARHKLAAALSLGLQIQARALWSEHLARFA